MRGREGPEESTPGTAGELGNENMDGACAIRSSVNVGGGGLDGDRGQVGGHGCECTPLWAPSSPSQIARVMCCDCDRCKVKFV